MHWIISRWRLLNVDIESALSVVFSIFGPASGLIITSSQRKSLYLLIEILIGFLGNHNHQHHWILPGLIWTYLAIKWIHLCNVPSHLCSTSNKSLINLEVFSKVLSCKVAKYHIPGKQLFVIIAGIISIFSPNWSVMCEERRYEQVSEMSLLATWDVNQ